MIGWVLACTSLALAGPTDDLLRQRQEVEQAASAVSDARADGARRSDVADLMRLYRDAAAALEVLEQTVAPSIEQARRDRLLAVADLNLALAEGQRASEARDVVVTWLGDPSQRFTVLTAATEAGLGAPATVRRGLLLDVVEQADALAVLLAFDAAAQERIADQLSLRALSLRRRGPGQAGSIASEVEALRLEAEASDADRQREAWTALRVQVLALRATVAVALEEP